MRSFEVYAGRHLPALSPISGLRLLSIPLYVSFMLILLDNISPARRGYRSRYSAYHYHNRSLHDHS